MDERKYTELDKIFQSRLGRNNQQALEWNTPSDDILESALDLIDLSEERPKSNRLVMFLSLLVVLLIGIASYNIYSVKVLQDKLGEMSVDPMVSELDESPVLEKKKIVNDNQKNDVPLPMSSKQMQKDVTSIASSEKINEEVKVNKIAHTPVKTDNTILSTYFNNTSSSLNLPAGKSEDDEAIVNTLPSADAVSELMNLASVPTIHPELVWTEEAETEMTLIPSVLNTAKEKSLNTPEMYLRLGSRFSSFRMSNVDPNSTALVNYDRKKFGPEYGLGLKQYLGERFSIDYSLSYSRLNNESLYRDQMIFDKDGAVENAEGEMVYDMPVQAESPTGIYATNFNFLLDELNLNDGSMLDNKTNINQVYDVISVSIKPGFDIVQSEKLKIGINAGVETNIIFGFCQELDMKIYHGSEMLKNAAMEDHSMDYLNNFLFGVVGEFSADYQWNSSWSSSLRIGSMRSINSLRKVSDSNSPGTYLEDVRVALTTGFHF